jgi:hypothetical protein
METIPAHGGRLINRELAGVERETLVGTSARNARIDLRPREVRTSR